MKSKVLHSAVQLFRILPVALISLCFLISTCQPASAEPLGERNAIEAIVGEARSEGRSWDDWQGKLLPMTAIAEAIRNRGHLTGVFGLKAKKNDPEWILKKCRSIAKQAWQDSAHTNLVKGADHWESTDFKKPKWAYAMIETARVGKTVFYKRK